MPLARALGMLVAMWVLVTTALPLSPALGADHPGKQIYLQQCAHCHGDQGEGVRDEYAQPLIGDRSLLDLKRLIAKTMPKDDVGSCTGDNADQVAAYIYDAFYSPTAQVRNRPPRIDLARLTVRQYRNALADLVGSFRWAPPLEAERGLKGEYYKSRRFKREDRIIERVDGEVNFNFGEASPDPEKAPDGNEFCIRWEGSLLAPETGTYDIVVRTDHAMRLWLNDNNLPFIDATVKSGDDNEYRASIFLLAGRAYPLKLEFIKAKQGVDDSKEKKPKPAPASIALMWQLPHRTPEVIGERYLTPQRYPESFVVATAFPPDDRSMGYERGDGVSKEWDAATTDAAFETAAFIERKLNELAGTKDDAGDREQKLREFCVRFLERAFRRPLSDAQRAFYIDRQFDAVSDKNIAVKRVVLLALKSPRFLFHQSPHASDSHAVAERLAWAMWDSLPDQALRDAANAGKLTSAAEVTPHAERMAKDLRARAKLEAFFGQWLRLDHMAEISKDSKGYPDFTPEIATQLRTSLDLMIGDILESEQADYRQLLLSDQMYMNGRLAKFYGAPLAKDAKYQKVQFEPQDRAGVLSHPLLMSGFAYSAATSPIHRGVFVSRSLLGRALKAPPEAVAPLAPDLHADLSTRERTELQTKAEMCMGCHAMINPLGYAFERFDAVGRLRSEEKGKPINATGSYELANGEVREFTGVRQLGEFLAHSEDAHNAFVTQLFHNVVKQSINAYGQELTPRLRTRFVENNFNIRRLMVDIAVSAALHAAPQEEVKATQEGT